MSKLDIRNLSVCVLVSCVIGCSQPKTPFDIGSTTSSVYTNSTLDMRVQFPSTWNVLSRDEIKTIMGAGTSMMTAGNRQLEAAVEASEDSTYHLFMVMQEPLGAPVEFNPNINASAEHVAGHSEIVSGEDYMKQVLNVLAMSQVPITVRSGPDAITINGKEFSKVQTILSLGGESIEQEMYATVVNDYAIVFALTFTSYSEKLVLDGVMQSVQFTN